MVWLYLLPLKSYMRFKSDMFSLLLYEYAAGPVSELKDVIPVRKIRLTLRLTN
jgi:hypothetical protein